LVVDFDSESKDINGLAKDFVDIIITIKTVIKICKTQHVITSVGSSNNLNKYSDWIKMKLRVSITSKTTSIKAEEYPILHVSLFCYELASIIHILLCSAVGL